MSTPLEPSDLHEIQQLLYRYCAGVDRKDWALVRECYAADAHDDHGTISGSVDEFITWLQQRHERVRESFHFVSNVRVVATEPAGCVIESMCLVRQTLDRRDGTPLHISLGCRYIDLLRRVDGHWLVYHRRVTYDWAEEVRPVRDLIDGTEMVRTDRGSTTIDEVRALLLADVCG